LLDHLGAECPVEGVIYLGQRNGADGDADGLCGGVVALQVSIVAAVGMIPIRASRVVFDRYDKRRTSQTAR
jgi:hypothetical protein